MSYEGFTLDIIRYKIQDSKAVPSIRLRVQSTHPSCVPLVDESETHTPTRNDNITPDGVVSEGAHQDMRS